MRALALLVGLAVLSVGTGPGAAGEENASEASSGFASEPEFSRYLPSAPVLAVMGATGQDSAWGDEPDRQSRSTSSLSARNDPPWSPNVRIDDDSASGAQNEVSLAVDTNGNWYSGWNDARPGTTVYQCAYTGSRDGGVTWSANELYKGTRLPYCGDPVIASDDQGNLYRLAMPFTTSPGYDGDLDVSRSSDGGVTWSSWVTAISGNGSGLTDKPWIAADGQYVAVTYTWFGGGEIRFLRSLDGGVTWGGYRSFGTGQGTCVAISPTGRTHMGWGTSTVSHHYSDDQGATWSTIKQIGTGGNGGGGGPRSMPLPSCAVSDDGKHVYWVWAGRTTGSSEDVWMAHSGDSGSSWDTQKMINDDGSNARQVMPSVDVDAGGKVHVAWVDWRNGNPEAFYSSSTDNGGTWSANQRISDGTGPQALFQGDYDQIAVAPDGNVGFAWCDTRNAGNEGDIYFSKAKLGTGGGGGSVAWINITPPSANITADQTQQFNAVAFDTKGNQTNATFTWSASGGSVSQAGLYSPGPAGTFNVYANASGKSGSASVTVTAGALAAVVVKPNPATVTVGTARQFTAEGADAKGNKLPVTPTWGAQQGSISGTGLYTAPTKTGTDTITATDTGSGKSGTAAVTLAAGPVTRIDISPPSATITADQTQQYVAQGFDQHGNPATVSPTWSAGGGAISAAGIYTPGAVGTFTVTGSANGTSGTAQVTVTPGALSRIEVEPNAASITADETAQFAAKGFDQKGNAVAVSPSWSAAPSGSVDATGKFTPALAGTVTVKASQGALSGTATVTVRAGQPRTVEVEPAAVTITADSSAQFTARALDSKGNEVSGAGFDWSADEGSVVNGRYTPTKTGEFTVVATARGTTASGEGSVTVTPGRIVTARIVPERASLKVDETLQFTAVALDGKANEVPDAVPVWSLKERLGSIGQDGRYTATRAGETEVIATFREGALEITDSAKVTVTALDAMESVGKLFGGATNAMLFFVVLAALVAGLLVAGLLASRTRKARETAQMMGSPFTETPSPPLAEYPPPPPGHPTDPASPAPPGTAPAPVAPPPPYNPPPPDY